MAVTALWRRLTPLDRLLLAGLLLLAFGLLLAVAWLPGGSRVLVERDGRTIYQAPLGEARQVQLEGPLGMTTLVLDQAGAKIVASPCLNKVCIGMGQVGRTGEWLACLPNHLLVRIEGGTSSGDQDYDLISR